MLPHPWRSLAGLPREVWFLCAATLVNRAGTMVLPFLVLYLTEDLGVAAATAGVALSVHGAGALVGAPLAGRLADRWGPIRIMRLSLFGSAALLACFPWVRGLAGVLGLVFVWALVSEAFRPASLAAIGDAAPPEQRTAAFAAFRLAINLGMSLGPALGGLLSGISFQWLFVVDALTAVAAGGMLSVVAWRVPHRPVAEGAGDPGASRFGAIGDPRMRFFLAGFALAMVVFFQGQGALPLFLVRELGLSPSFYGLLFTLNTLVIVVFEVPLSARLGLGPRVRTLSVGAMLLGLGFAAHGLAGGRGVLVAATLVWTIGEMILFPAAAAYVTEAAPPGRLGAYMGAYQAAIAAALLVGPWAGTAILGRWGADAVWTATAVCGVLAALCMTRVPRDTPAAVIPAVAPS